MFEQGEEFPPLHIAGQLQLGYAPPFETSDYVFVIKSCTRTLFVTGSAPTFLTMKASQFQ